MDELKEYYRNALRARIEALESARKSYLNDDADALDTIRRIAHSLKGSGGTYGFPEVSEAAGKVEEAPDDSVHPALTELLGILREIAASEEDAQKKILIVEDDIELAHLLQVKLKSEQRQIIAVATAEEAKSVLQNEHLSLVILDLILPDYDGRNLLIEIREENATANLPVIITTAKCNPHIQSECYALGADAFFEKPFDPDALGAAVADKIHRTEAQKVAANKDALTGLPNRSGFVDIFEHSRRLALRQQSPLSIAMLDIDRFKLVNDTYGHNMGDQVLQTTAEIVTNSFRQSDILARWGGEEFIALFPDTDIKGAVKALEKALEQLRNYTFQSGGESFTVTFSAGVTEAEKDLDLQAQVARADQLLYAAKESGRNRVISDISPVEDRTNKIFLAEDDELIASVVKHRLEKAEFEVDHYTDGLNAYNAAKNGGNYSLYILDVKMPGMDGFELLQNIREMPKAKNIPIVMLTSMGSEKDVVRGFSLGADDYILKPFSPSELISRVNRLVNKS